MYKHIGLIGFVLLTLIAHIRGEELAVSLHIIAAEVTVQRVGTRSQVLLPVDAVASVGSGDVIRTGENGRALLSFADVGSSLLLPDTQLTIVQFSGSEDRSQLTLALQGVAIFDSIDAQFQLETSGFNIIEANGDFGVWGLQDERQGVVIHSGTATLGTASTIVGAGEAWLPFLDDAIISDVRSSNPAQIIGETIGCDAVVDTIENEGLLIRAGNGQGYEALDILPENSTAVLVGISDDSTRLRVQFDSGFGWVEALGVQHNCNNLTIYSGTQLEKNLRIFEVDDIELDYFVPYYGTKSSNKLFFPESY